MNITPEEKKERKRALYAAYYARPEIKERALLLGKAWRAANRERVKAVAAINRERPGVRERERAHVRAYRAKPGNREKNCEYQRKQSFVRLYGITLEQKEQMAVSQNQACAICFRVRKLCVDHCHTTGKVRALLCPSCNTAIGLLQESLTVLESVKSYLQKHTTS